jgi:HK97 gp10 family phage protein
VTVRWDLHPEALAEIPTQPLLRHLAEDVAKVAETIAPERTGALKLETNVEGVYDNAAYVVAKPRNRGDEAAGHPEDAPYAYYVEKGTSHMAAQPFLRPALYRYRTP